MKEDFLQLIWQNQYLLRNKDWLIDSDLLAVHKPGFLNRDSGPDFLQAKLQIGDLEWIGSVEIHVRSSEWNQHKHQHDPAYQSVILHVVWEKDVEIFRADKTKVPTLELKNLVPLEVILRYRQLMDDAKPWIPCDPFLDQIDPFLWISMQERVLVERLQRKALVILDRFEANGKDWIETFYQTLAWSLGLKLNADSMLRLAEGLPSKILANVGYRFEAVLPLLLGVGGFLDETSSDPIYTNQQSEFQFYNQKYRLSPSPILWQKFRLRPTSFPQIRIILFARMVAKLPFWYHQLTEVESSKTFFEGDILAETPVWIDDLITELHLPKGGLHLSSFIKNGLVINVFAPFLTAISLHQNNQEMIERALNWLSELKPESNTILKNWENRKITCQSAAQSQALLELFTQYCAKKNCMSCAVGNRILGKF